MEIFKLLISNWLALIIVGICLASIVSSIAKQIRKFACHQQELAFKRDLIESGLAVEEVERLVSAKADRHDKDS